MDRFAAWTTTTLHTLRDRSRGESGQGSVEYVGIVIIVVAIVAAVAGSATTIGTTIVTKLTDAVTSVGT